MSSTPDNVTTTTTNTPPAFMVPGMQTAINAALGDFQRMGGQVAQGGPMGAGPTGGGGGIGGMLGDFLGRIQGGQGAGTTPTAGAGGAFDLLPGAQGLIGSTIGGDYLNANPYLDQAFNNAAGATQNRLASEFGGAGRNIGASMPARSQELQYLASNIYGGNYQAERDRQLNAVSSAQGLDPTNLLINRIGGLIPGAGGTSQGSQPVFQSNMGLFGGLGALLGGIFG